MSFKRIVMPETFATGKALTGDLIGIGMLLAGKRKANVNIENTLVAASLEGLGGDLRVLSLLVDWFDAHSERVNADRLYRMVTTLESKSVHAFWSALSLWKKADPRFLKLASSYKGPRINLLTTGTDFQISRHGEDTRFVGTPLRAPKGAGLRHRPADILPPERIARIHRAYYYRIIIGPTYRADMWADLEQDPELSAAELARRSYGSFATAWQVKREWQILSEAA